MRMGVSPPPPDEHPEHLARLRQPRTGLLFVQAETGLYIGHTMSSGFAHDRPARDAGDDQFSYEL